MKKAASLSGLIFTRTYTKNFILGYAQLSLWDLSNEKLSEQVSLRAIRSRKPLITPNVSPAPKENNPG